jgi:hypothetical protein
MTSSGNDSGPVAEGGEGVPAAPEDGASTKGENQIDFAKVYSEAKAEPGVIAEEPRGAQVIDLNTAREAREASARASIEASDTQENSSDKRELVRDPEQKEVLPFNNINQLVIDAQKAAGWDVGEAWYDKYVTQIVGNDAPENVMYGCFMAAFDEHFPVGQDGLRHPDDEARAMSARPMGAESLSVSTQQDMTTENKDSNA